MWFVARKIYGKFKINLVIAFYHFWPLAIKGLVSSMVIYHCYVVGSVNFFNIKNILVSLIIFNKLIRYDSITLTSLKTILIASKNII